MPIEVNGGEVPINKNNIVIKGKAGTIILDADLGVIQMEDPQAGTGERSNAVTLHLKDASITLTGRKSNIRLNADFGGVWFWPFQDGNPRNQRGICFVFNDQQMYQGFYDTQPDNVAACDYAIHERDGVLCLQYRDTNRHVKSLPLHRMDTLQESPTRKTIPAE